MEFEWDSTKAETNEKKHGITFNDAALLFSYDPLIEDSPRAHSAEPRFVAIGELPSGIPCVVIVAFTPRESRLRIISARPAAIQERNRYHAYRQNQSSR